MPGLMVVPQGRMKSGKRAIWISWEDHRRTTELCGALGVPLYTFTSKGSRISRYVVLTVRTVLKLMEERPDLLFVQNPSLALSLLGVFYKLAFGKRLIVDAHTSGVFPFDGKSALLNLVCRYIHRKSDLTIVTTSSLKDAVERNRGMGFVLQDRLPGISPGKAIKLKGAKNILSICSFSWDEPYNEVIEAASRVGSGVCVYITGNYRKAPGIRREALPENVVLTGFLPEEEYLGLLSSADVLVDLTTREDCLLCGAYEAVALGKPFIISKTLALMEYFTSGCVYAGNTAEGIAEAIRAALSTQEELEEEVKEFREELRSSWEEKFTDFKKNAGV